VLTVQRVRWVGGYGRMDSATGEQYDAAAPDPVTPSAAGAIAHLNADHAEALAAMVQAFGGYPDATTAVCTGIDRYGLDMRVDTPRGVAYARVNFPDRLDSADQLRLATAELARLAVRGLTGDS
jgi:heme oxygenase (biliverdin-IX-beta and delta-forming)